MRKNSRSNYSITVAKKSDIKDMIEIDLFNHIGDGYDDIVNEALEEFADDTLTAADFVIVDYDCPHFINDDFRSMLVDTSLEEAETDITYILDLLDEANENGGYYNFDDLVFLALNSEDPDNIVVYGDRDDFDDYMKELLREDGVKPDSLAYKGIDFDKLYETLSSEYEEYDLPSGNKAWM